jgi:hypothetical protein
MPRVAASNGVRPEIRALAVMQMGKPVTPSEINACVGTGDYAAKYISFLKNRYGFDFSVQKNGRQVVSYTMLKEPSNVAELRGAQPKQKAVKVAKVAKPSKAQKVIAKVAPSVKNVKDQEADRLLAELNMKNAGEVAGGSYSIDNDWDSVEGVDLKALIV